ncbi:MAG TPA: hypothetical protein VHE81_12895 [Lacipirellulaceae bacterium]|nr:hypothetical protein [Lacipirellulaceae bacterium]
MSVVLLSSDLAVLSRVEGAAVRAGRAVRSATTAAQVLDYCRDTTCDAVLIDLSSPLLDIASLIRELSNNTASAPQTVAFGPHVHEARLADARRAGCDRVVSRGQFFAQLDSILGG